MGLDNGICVRRTPKSEKIKWFRKFEEKWDKDHKWDFEIAYFRKCWNVRRDIFDLCLEEIDEGYQYKLTAENITQIIKILQSYNENTWDISHSIWEWDDMKSPVAQYIKNLKMLRWLMRWHDLEVYFYDSY